MVNSSFIDELREYLNNTLNDLDSWFQKDEHLRKFVPANKGWNIDQILEHISLTSHYLLILIDKGVKKSINRSKDINWKEIVKNYSFKNSKLEEVGQHLSFEWIRPKHMEPGENQNLDKIRNKIKQQFEQCSNYLDMIPNGEGVLHKTTMSVNNLGKIDVYQYIYFLGKHAERHIEQMKKIENEFHEYSKS